MAHKFNVGHCNELINAEAEKFIALFEKTFTMKKIFQWGMRKKEGDLGDEDCVITTFLLKLQIKSEKTVCQTHTIVKELNSEE